MDSVVLAKLERIQENLDAINKNLNTLSQRIDDLEKKIIDWRIGDLQSRLP